ncbi:Uncharacterized protein dnl_31240 [Desulfonema limicola]|uniref:Uncharacterized protein n=1 Tax=Desulfonema limicola TaxID=45656 RepID=A0A975B8V0_9BACT|nr:hypothetical protein [Desulfonema limicola]QTA80811.1 Uncharacterized protein dnl_31240 [Desulfonema limicola]
MNNIKEISPYLWWAKQILLTVSGLVFMLFGIQILIAAYKLNDPFSFIMTFFASNLIILISAALMAGFVYKMVAQYKNINKKFLHK